MHGQARFAGDVDDARAKLDATKEYMFAVAEDFNRGMKEGWFKPKDDAVHRELLQQWATLEKEFVAYYNRVTDDVFLTPIGAGDVIHTCADFRNRARVYQAKLAAIPGSKPITPIPPEDKPPPTVAQAVSDVGKGLVAVACAVGLVVALSAIRR